MESEVATDREVNEKEGGIREGRHSELAPLSWTPQKGDNKPSDVGPVTRQSLTRADSFFGSRAGLTLFSKLTRSQVPE